MSDNGSDIFTVECGPFHLDIVKFALFIKDLVSQDLDEETKKATKDAIDVVLKGYKLLVKAWVPFLKVGLGSTFKEQFTDSYNQLLSHIEKAPDQNLILNCHRVFYLLQELSNKPNRLNRKSLADKHAEMKELALKWWLNDDHVGEALKKFRRDIRNRLWNIYTNLESRPIEESKKDFRLFLEENQPKFDEIEDQTNILLDIGNKL
jgi:hypothetical protein